MKEKTIRSVATALICVLVTGCATAPDRHLPYHFQGSTKNLRLESAYREPFSAHLCFKVKGSGAKGNRYLGIRLPMPDGPLHIPLRGQIPTLRVRNEDITNGSCITDGTPMTIIQGTLDGASSLPKGQEEALYVFYQREELAALGYVSAKPIFANHHSYAVDLEELFSPPPEANKRIEEGARVTVQIVQVILLLFAYWLLLSLENDASKAGESEKTDEEGIWGASA